MSLTRRLLGAAAVLGEQFAVAIVASLIDQPVMACMRPLEEARDSGLLEAAATAGEWRLASIPGRRCRACDRRAS
jgi:hypothetical protein